jgi:hypothetical protein
VFNATFNNIAVTSWLSVLLVGETGVPGKTTDLPQVTSKLYHTMVYPSTSRLSVNVHCSQHHFYVNTMQQLLFYIKVSFVLDIQE